MSIKTISTPTLLIGASGFVGLYILNSIKGKIPQLYIPTKNDFDITNDENIRKYLKRHLAKVIINFAAYTDITEAEKQRGDRTGIAWLINVEGVKNLSEVCEKNDIFLIHISTDAVFPGTDKFPGPYPETTTPPNNLKPLSWYGYTKLQGELVLTNSKAKHALIRISYPFGNKNSSKDFVYKVTEYIKKGLSLFSDQKFTPTYLPDLTNALIQIASYQIEGTFHVATHSITTPYEFGVLLAQNPSLTGEVKKSLVREYLKSPTAIPRLIHGGLLTRKTEKKLAIRFHSWEDAVNKFTQFTY